MPYLNEILYVQFFLLQIGYCKHCCFESRTYFLLIAYFLIFSKKRHKHFFSEDGKKHFYTAQREASDSQRVKEFGAYL